MKEKYARGQKTLTCFERHDMLIVAQNNAKKPPDLAKLRFCKSFISGGFAILS